MSRGEAETSIATSDDGDVSGLIGTHHLCTRIDPRLQCVRGRVPEAVARSRTHHREVRLSPGGEKRMLMSGPVVGNLDHIEAPPCH